MIPWGGSRVGIAPVGSPWSPCPASTQSTVTSLLAPRSSSCWNFALIGTCECQRAANGAVEGSVLSSRLFPGLKHCLGKSLGVCLLESSSNTVAAPLISRGLGAPERLHRFGSRHERILKLSLSCACGQRKFQSAAASGPAGPGLALEPLVFNPRHTKHLLLFQGLLMLLQNLPTIHWGNEEIGLLLAEAYRLKYMFADAPNHYRR